MRNNYKDGHYWSHSTFGPSHKAAHRKIEILDGFVRVIEPENSEHRFRQDFFFDVNTMVGPVEPEVAATA